MTMETTREKVLYLVVVPIIAAAAGAFVTSLIQGQNCLPTSGDDLASLIRDASMTGQQKLQALQLYKEITGRPWTLISSVSGSLVAIGGFAAAYLLSTRKR